MAAGCSSIQGPQGWAGARPVEAGGGKVILAAHKSRLFALPPDTSNPRWQFPPRDRSAYAVSDERRALIGEALDGLGGSGGGLQQRLDDLRLDGPSAGELKKAIDATAADSAARSRAKDAVDDAIKDEKRALSGVRALYGDIGVSSDGGTAFVPTFGGWLFALDVESGAARWMVELDSGMVGGVAVDDDQVFVGTRHGTLYALGAEDGAQQWRMDAGGEIWATPTVANDAIYVSTLDGDVIRLDRSGGVSWRRGVTSSAIASQVVLSGETLYAGAWNNKLYALSASDGSTRWTFEGDNWFWGAPAVRDGVVYATNLDDRVYAVDAATGEPRWDRPFSAGAPVRAGAMVAGDALIVADRAGEVHKLDLESGEELGAPIDLQSRIESNLTQDSEGQIYVVPRARTLWVIDPSADLVAASFPLP